MAEGTVKKTTTKNTTTTNTKVEDKKNDDGLKDVLEMVNQLKAQLDNLTKENDELKQIKKEVAKKNEINNDEEIEVMSLFSGTLNLFTDGFGNGNAYKFTEGYGSIIDIPYIDLKNIVKNNDKIAKEGYFYILNEDVVNSLRLKKAYSNLLSAEIMSSLTNAKVEQIESLYKSAPKSQKELMLDYFATRKENKESVDISILYKLQELSGKKIMD